MPLNLPNPYDAEGHFSITSGLVGAPSISASLITISKTGFTQGYGTVSQAVYPPLQFQTKLAGVAHATGAGKAEQIFDLHGIETSQLVGAPRIVSLLIVLDGIWGTTGKASYVLFEDTPEPKEFKDQKVAVTWIRKP